MYDIEPTATTFAGFRTLTGDRLVYAISDECPLLSAGPSRQEKSDAKHGEWTAPISSLQEVL